MSTEFGIGKGITITTGFDVATQKPLDSRTVVHDLDELSNIPAGMVYLGLTVFVISENKLYQRKYKVDEDSNYITDADGNQIEEWGPIESEISSKDIESLDEIDFNDTPIYMLQKNKKDFFPMTHEDAVFIDKEGKTMSDKYQTIVDSKLDTDDKTMPGAINEINTKMADKIAQFEEEIQETLASLRQDVATMQAETQENLDNLETEMENTIADIEKEMQAKIDQMLQDVDNVILSDTQVNDLMEQINMNIALIDSDGSMATMMASFKAYNSHVIVDTPVTEVSLDPLGVTVTSSDKLFVHINSVYLTEDVDYIINYTDQQIENITDTPWNAYSIAGCEIAFDLIKKTII